MSEPLALIVDDEPDILELLDITLARMGISCRPAADLAAARALLARERFDFCLTDMRLPDGRTFREAFGPRWCGTLAAAVLTRRWR